MTDASLRQQPIPATTVARDLPLLLFAATLFLSAVLLFAVQPMFSKIALPLLGGAPGVWNTAMVFFQTTLLLGYAYAHLTARFIGPGRQVPLHLVVLIVGLTALPVAAAAWTPPTDEAPIPWLIGFLGVSIGLPFFAVSATAPLLQRWFAQTDHPSARDPYFLYGASNLGSILALLGYPIIVERLLGLRTQGVIWTAGYVGLIALIGICGFIVWRRPAVANVGAVVVDDVQAGTVAWGQRFMWVALAFVPSSLLLGVTTHISTDIAATPLFWVVPLAIYLLTFVIVFARRPVLRHAWLVRAQPLLLIPFVFLFGLLPAFPLWCALLAHLLMFFVNAMVCHGELARRRPAARHLTEFYLWMSVGGMLGGMFNGLLAPAIFDGVYEYPIALVLACLLRPWPARRGRSPVTWQDLLVPAALALVLETPALLPSSLHQIATGAGWIVAGCLLLSAADRPLRFALGVVAVLFANNGFEAATDVVERERSFFGVNSIKLDEARGVAFILHGHTVHGAQYQDPSRRREPLIYYGKDGPVGQLFDILAKRGDVRNVGIAGLGVGSLACYRQPGQRWSFYDIDPTVVQMARDTRYFHYLVDCAGDARIVLGDARQSLTKEPAGAFDLLVLDVFSSDSIPVHLLTREALALYLEKLADDGVLAIHISNRFLDLKPIVADLAADAGLAAWAQSHRPGASADSDRFKVPALWVVMTRKVENLAAVAADGRWRRLESRPGSRVWRDDYSNIVGAITW